MTPRSPLLSRLPRGLSVISGHFEGRRGLVGEEIDNGLEDASLYARLVGVCGAGQADSTVEDFVQALLQALKG